MYVIFSGSGIGRKILEAQTSSGYRRIQEVANVLPQQVDGLDIQRWQRHGMYFMTSYSLYKLTNKRCGMFLESGKYVCIVLQRLSSSRAVNIGL
jgi:hypothetical protein